MLSLWLTLRRLRRNARPRSEERRTMESYLREHEAFMPRRSFFAHPRMQFVIVGSVVVALLFGSVGSYAYASDSVLPDTPLYVVKQAVEQVETTLAITPARKTRVQAKLQVRREREVKKLRELERVIPTSHEEYLGIEEEQKDSSVLKPREKMERREKIRPAERREQRERPRDKEKREEGREKE